MIHSDNSNAIQRNERHARHGQPHGFVYHIPQTLAEFSDMGYADRAKLKNFYPEAYSAWLSLERAEVDKRYGGNR